MIYDRVKALVSLDAIAYNFEEMHKKLKPGVKLVAVIKADGYGHGAEAIARMVEPYEYVWGFAVATADEADHLRKIGMKKPILILGLVLEDAYENMIRQDVRMAVSEYSMAKELSDAAVAMGMKAKVHLALDTGMTRIGFADNAESVPAIKAISELPNLEIEGMFTHFARADEYDVAPAYVQLGRYDAFEKLLSENGIHVPVLHCANSAGIMRVPEAQHHMVRAGITIYGIYPSDEVERELLPLKPAMELKSRVTYVKDVPAGCGISYGAKYVTEETRRVATIPVGYADGYSRGLSNKGYVLIHGKKAPILGRVCMDQFMVDVTDIPDVKRGDAVTLIGADGDEFISIEYLGDLSGRFSYEFACEISKRVPRVYIYEGKEYTVENLPF
ncbi:MAG: alanine racemase [Clostridiales bacterium]|nr:alanine racemase [Candidatus Blautia equi]